MNLGTIGAFVLLLIIIAIVVAIYTISGSVGRSIDRQSAIEVQRQAALLRQQQEQHDLEMAQARALAPIQLQVWHNFYTSLATVGVVSFTVLMVAVVGCGIFAGVGASRSFVRYTNTQATLIKLNPVTRQYPLIPYTLAGVPRLYNPNTGSVVLLDAPRAEMPQLVTGMAAVQIAGIIAREARQSNDPAGMAMINPPLIVGK